MTRTLRMTCQCCGAGFLTVSTLAKWCSGPCRQRAYHRRQQGRPELDPGVGSQLALYATGDNLPAAWRKPPAGTEERVWQGTAIQRREADGFVNATAMCQANRKLFADYARLARTREYMAALANVVGEKPCGAAVVGNPITGPRGSTGNPITAGLIHTIQGGTPALQGTWIHPRLAIDLARWISPAFAVWMDGWFLESIARPARPAQPPLAQGIHIVAPTKRDAHRMWGSALRRELAASLQLLDQELFGTPGLVPSPVTIHVPA